MGPLAFGPEGILFVADTKAAAVVALATADTQPASGAKLLKVERINQKIAALLGTSADQILIHLLPRTNYGGGLRKVVIQTLEGINGKGLEHPCLPGRKLKLRLGQRSELELKMNVKS